MNTCEEQASSLYSWKVTVPVGSVPKRTVATLLSPVPTVAAAGTAWVVMSVTDRATVTVARGSPHGVGPAGLLRASPL